jgi:hypothetical protein
MLADLSPDATAEEIDRHVARRCNARAHRNTDNSEIAHAAGEAFSATIAILDALGLDIAESLEWLQDHGGMCDCTVGFNVLADDPNEGRA